MKIAVFGGNSYEWIVTYLATILSENTAEMYFGETPSTNDELPLNKQIADFNTTQPPYKNIEKIVIREIPFLTKKRLLSDRQKTLFSNSVCEEICAQEINECDTVLK